MPPIGNIQLGRLGQLYVITEAAFAGLTGGAYGPTTIAASNALRHLEVDLGFDPFKWTNAPDRRRSSGIQRRVKHVAMADFDLKKAQMWPSGAAGTPPELDPILLNGIGAKRLPNATTTVASSPTTTGATLTSGTGLQVGDFIGIQVATDQFRVVKLLTVAGAVVTWTPTLPVAPSVADNVTTGVDYTLATELPATLYAAHYLLSNGVALSREMLGIALDELTFTIEQAQEPMISAKGPSQYVNRATAQAQPGGFTTVGTVLPTGMQADLIVGTAVYKVQKAVITHKNNEVVRTKDIGSDRATDYYRQKQREITIQVDAYVENPAPIVANAETGTTVALLLQCGTAAGKSWAWYLPSVLFDVPAYPDGNEELVWSLKGQCMEVNGNDEYALAQM